MIEFFAAAGPRLMLDESSVLDIGSLLVGSTEMAPGRAIPDDGDPRIDHSLQGFLFTCGPDHIRHPEPMAGGRGTYPLHGSFASHPAEIILNERRGRDAECRARVTVSCADGNRAELERQWRIDGMTGEVHLRDRLTNTSDVAFPPMLMYHMNVAASLFDDAVMLSGAMLEGGGFPWRFGKPGGDIFCVPAGFGGSAELRLGPIRAIGGLTLTVRFRTETLPFLQVWRNQTAPADVLGIEPVSHRWMGRAELEKAGELTTFAPGESREYGLSFAFV